MSGRIRGVRMDAIGSRAAEVAYVWAGRKANVKLATIIATIRRFDEWDMACSLWKGSWRITG
ncbi:hypothetical protein CPAR01_07199 [Colletotrichum paranaense]|uniref:Uncharacterized protein n=4 Tax=Colletotrichum acutatum species complex TaxID=2707335 RepID=A0AAI9UUT5_9PEZI|nr:uncharacterized protein CPAR01_07199 [Colletotrichum paranaense]XP_060372662.1 uncharacterized protein CTAM01_16765 [Colletotrichum tamarilloi]XP_060392175.1 uncharacterized protein CABS01_15010 [Colletotrichum abscissum]KAI3541479.1 hypothetical protein CSPX01_07567 [Colletotrichum filicis]KAK1465166.1 hypothetical protein CMEL01_12521 [Colletotrichum melonis]KAK1703008.1 hypothetical protein BDP67DRAFT_536746 [Colletotrichum lupini]KAK1470474.1 hypothetical protein CTAM01_16765 [Colletot